MWQVIKEIFSLICKKSKKNFLILIILTFLMSIFEILGLALIMPFLFLVSNLNLVETNQHINMIYTFLGFHDKLSFLYFIGAGAMLFSFIGMLLSVFTNIKLTKFSNNLGVLFSIKLLNYYTQHKEDLSKEHQKIRKQILTEPTIIASNIILPSLTIISRIILVIVLFTVLMIINYQTTLIFSTVLFIIYFILFKLTNKKVQYRKTQIEHLKREKSLLINNILTSNHQINEKEKENLLKEYAAHSSLLSEYQSFNNVIAKLPRYLMMFLIFSAVVLVSSYLVSMYSGDMDDVMHKMLLYIVIRLKTLPQIQNIFMNYIKLKSNLSSFTNIKEELSKASQ